MNLLDLFESQQQCPECGGPAFADLLLAEKKDACYSKVRSRYKVWPSAYASGALVQCRKKGAANWGNKSEGVAESDTGDTPIDAMTVQELAEYLGVSEQQVAADVEHARDMAREKAQDLTEEFDLIESIIDCLAEHNGVAAEAIWEDLESLTDDELYVFAVTMPLMEDWQKVNKRDKTDGMSRKAVNAYRRENPGSKLKTAVTTKPSKLKRGSKASKRRKSYCSRSRGQMKMHSISCAKTPDKAICKARRRWNCESIDFNLAEMDKTQTSPGRDGDIDWTKKQIHLGPEHIIKAKDVAKDALKALDKTMKKSHADTPKKKGVEEAFGPLPRDSQQIRLGRHTVDIERVGLDKNYISFAWNDSQGQEHYEEVPVGDLGSYDDLIEKIKQEISYQERQYTDQGVAEGLPQILRKVVPGYAKREIDRKMDAGKFGKTDADKDANFQRYKKIQDKLKEQGVAEGDDEKIGGRYDPEEFDAMIGRLKNLAGAGPMKTVWDPVKRVYKNVPVAQQPKPQPR